MPPANRVRRRPVHTERATAADAALRAGADGAPIAFALHRPAEAAAAAAGAEPAADGGSGGGSGGAGPEPVLLLLHDWGGSSAQW